MYIYIIPCIYAYIYIYLGIYHIYVYIYILIYNIYVYIYIDRDILVTDIQSVYIYIPTCRDADISCAYVYIYTCMYYYVFAIDSYVSMHSPITLHLVR